MADARQKLIGLLDYVEQVVRLDERVAFRLSEYRLPDGTTFAVAKSDTQNLPGVRHDHRDDEEPVWLEVERLVRKEPPTPPATIAEWVVVPADPARSPEVRSERFVTTRRLSATPPWRKAASGRMTYLKRHGSGASRPMLRRVMI
jgi:hypothetical protein